MSNRKAPEPKKLTLIEAPPERHIYDKADSALKELIDKINGKAKKRKQSPINPEHPGFKPVA